MAGGLDPRTPVLIGSAAITQREKDPTRARDAIGLMAATLRAAADNAGGADPQRLLSKADVMLATQGSWKCQDPARMVSEQLAITPHTVYAELGVLQQSLFTRACTAIAAGDASVALIAGGEARARMASAARQGVQVTAEPEAEKPADTVLSPAQQVISRLEIDRQLFVAARQYGMIETALRAAAGQSLEEHAREVAALWDGFAAIAATRPEAWKRDVTPLGDGLATPQNPWYSWPYTKQHVSYWTVDQAAAFILCSVEAAESAGIPREHWVFPHAAVESNAMIMLSERAEPDRSPAITANGRALAELAGIAPADADYVDLYSCFPSAVRVQAAELGLTDGRALTVTGGMSFGGGPLNNYVLQSTARMMDVLREDPGSSGLITSISGMITKHGMGLWSTNPADKGFQVADVSEQALAQTRAAAADPNYQGPADVIAYTVTYERDVPHSGIVIARAAQQGALTHTVAVTNDPGLLTELISSEWVGRRIDVTADGFTG
jgi:acetyl-CoA C-acetyltransferase